MVEPLNDLGEMDTDPTDNLIRTFIHPSLHPFLPPSPSVGILATLVDARGMVLVPDFYAEVEVGLEGGRKGRKEEERRGGVSLKMYMIIYSPIYYPLPLFLLPPSTLPFLCGSYRRCLKRSWSSSMP